VSEQVPVYSVSEITSSVRRTLEAGYGRVRIRGEMSNLRLTPSGHRYFVLKDELAQLRAVFFRGDALSLRFAPADGLEVEAIGDITVYETRGELQLVVRRLAPSGIGALLMSLEALKKRLAADGLFDPARKRFLPAYPRTIGVVTSPTGAAIRDILKVLKRRWPVADVVFHPVTVQGDGAADEIARALYRLNRWGRAEVIIVGRGGGSLEDLWAFNEEIVVRAVASSHIPVISAVGHETDVTLCDLAADVRAPTPSAAAEMAVPNIHDLYRRMQTVKTLLERRMNEAVGRRRAVLVRLARAYGFRRPERFLERRAEEVDDVAERLQSAIEDRLETVRHIVDDRTRRLLMHHPERHLEHAHERLLNVHDRLRVNARGEARRRRERLVPLSRALRALDPAQVLRRGYCLVRDPGTGHLVLRAAGVSAGSPLVIQFSEDRLHARAERGETGGPWTPSVPEEEEQG